MPKLEKGHKANFNTLLRAANNNDIALLDCQDKATKKPVRVIVALQRETDGSTSFIPLAKLFDGNPYDELNPPNVNGGYYADQTEGN